LAERRKKRTCTGAAPRRVDVCSPGIGSLLVLVEQSAPKLSSGPPLAVIGVPVHNGTAHLEEALDSLAAQTLPALRVVLLDDCSTDGSYELARARAATDQLVVERNERRQGLSGSWARVFELATARYPAAPYFAWGSDHDVWHPEWLEALAAELERSPAAVLAYPLVRAIEEDGSPRRRRVTRFETRDQLDRLARLRAATAGMRAGDMVYGLYRVDALRRCGGFPSALLPDRLLLARLALEGEFVQVDRELWQRRYRSGVRPSFARQRRTLFASPTPRRAYLPWWVPHAALFFQSLRASPRERTRLTIAYLRSATRAVRRERRDAARRRRRLRRRERRRTLAALWRRLPSGLTRPFGPLVRALTRRWRG
jgi:glycosyltransferase involved in cell wall biosynthesis